MKLRMIRDQGYEHKSGSLMGEKTMHIHYIGESGSTTHKHHNVGRHQHKQEAHNARVGGKPIQTGYLNPNNPIEEVMEYDS